MKNIKYILIVSVIFAWSCSQEWEDEVTTTEDPVIEVETPSAGSADFTKFVSAGNSLTAGYQAGALFTEGQANSVPAILAKQFKTVGGGDFNQPDINSENGFFGALPDGTILGRLVLKTNAEGATAPSPTLGDVPTPFAGDKAALNNFGVPGILLGQCLAPLTGGPAENNPAFNPLYARFASSPGTSTIIGDMAAAQGTFFMFWLGNNDVLGFAANGGTFPTTDVAAFEFQYDAAIGVLTANPDVKGVIGNIGDVTNIPFFNLVPYNAIPFDVEEDAEAAATIAALNGGFAAFNGVLDNLVLGGVLPAEVAEARKITFQYADGANPLFIQDTDLMDLGPIFDGLVAASLMTVAQREQLQRYTQGRPMMEGELVTLRAASVIGTLAVSGDASTVIGVGAPLADQFVLTMTELEEVATKTAAFNAKIKAVADASDKIALADVAGAFSALATAGGGFDDGVILAPSLAPPFGLFSEDGVHPNNRGAAFMAKVFIDAINAEFGAKIPQVKLGDYTGTRLPIAQ